MEVYENIQDDGQEREGVVAQGERAQPLPQPRLPRSTGGSGARTDAHTLPQLVWIAGKIKDDIEEFGYGSAPVRIKSDHEPAIIDVRRAVIPKRSNAPNIPVNSPVGDPQSNGRVENAIKKVRNMVKTIISTLESKWGIRVTRDQFIPWMFEWAADLMTRCAHGDLGKDGSSVDSRINIKQKHCAIRQESLVQTVKSYLVIIEENMEDTFLDGNFSGHETAIR